MEEEIRELRLELKTARSDVKRYASYALRLQQELAREKLKRADQDEDNEIPHDFNGNYTVTSETFVWDKKVDQARKEHVAWIRKIDRVVQLLEEDETPDNRVDERAGSVIREVLPFLKQQRHFITELGRENAKLRDMVHARPTRRELLTSQLEVERLQRHVRKLQKGAKCKRETISSNEGLAGKAPSLSERITDERVLQLLRVRTERSTTHHVYLNEKLRCFLSLELASLASRKQEMTEVTVLERLGRICSDIVASCCYVLEVDEVGELPRRVEKAHQLAHVTASYQAFVERIKKLLKRFDKDAFYSIRADSTAETSCHEALDMILSHVNDVLVELDARREQMTPPGSKAHEVILKNMKLLQVARIDQLAPTIRRLVDNMKAEQDFQHELRKLLGLDQEATRKQILKVATMLFSELGFLTGTTACLDFKDNQ